MIAGFVSPKTAGFSLPKTAGFILPFTHSLRQGQPQIFRVKDLWRDSLKEGAIMPAYKDKKRGTWYVSFNYKDWQGKQRKTLKRGFATKREALQYENEFKQKKSGTTDMDLKGSRNDRPYKNCQGFPQDRHSG